MKDYVNGNRELGMKFTGLDILDVMGRIAMLHMQHCQSDFELDKELICEAAQEPGQKGRAYLWLCRRCGTWCLDERDVFIRGTREHNTAMYYAGQASDDVLAFTVEVAGPAGGAVAGNLYPLAYRPYSGHIAGKSVDAGGIVLRYERGERIIAPDKHFDASADRGLGRFLGFEFQPASPEGLEALLREEGCRRSRYGEGSIRGYLEWLASREAAK